MLPCLPHDAGASLPLVQRYTDFRFRRVVHARVLRADRADLVEVAALLRIMDAREARWIFRWPPRAVRFVRALEDDPGLAQATEPLARRNAEVLTPDHCLALINAMRDGGWEKPRCAPLPAFFKLAIRARRDEGWSVDRIAAWSGFGHWTIQYGFRVPHGRRMAVSRRGLAL